jgi:HD-like signal output (HDOD) protein
VSRAVSLVGFNAVRNMALSLVLLEHMQDKTNANLLKEEFLRALMAGSIAAELGNTTAEGEEAFIGALFQNLGRMLSQFYFPEEAASIRKLVNARDTAVSEEAASTRVLGLSFEALGLGVAKAWGLPDSIQRCIVRPAGEPPPTRWPTPCCMPIPRMWMPIWPRPPNVTARRWARAPPTFMPPHWKRAKS